VGLACVGCVTGTAGFDPGVPYALAPEDALAMPGGPVTRRLAAATEDLAGPKKGFGFGVGYQSTGFFDWHTKATDAVPTGDPLDPYEGQHTYKDLFDNGNGLSFFGIISRPSTGTLSIGDSYLLWRADLGFPFQKFAGKEWDELGRLGGPTTFGSLEQMGLWVEAKTMLNPVGRALRPYARYSTGIVMINALSAETVAGPVDFWDTTWTMGLSGGFGVDIHLGLWFFVDVGVQIIGAPKAGGDGGVGRAEPMVASPIRFGALFNF
jgi:hypothetical protein